MEMLEPNVCLYVSQTIIIKKSQDHFSLHKNRSSLYEVQGPAQ